MGVAIFAMSSNRAIKKYFSVSLLLFSLSHLLFSNQNVKQFLLCLIGNAVYISNNCTGFPINLITITHIHL